MLEIFDNAPEPQEPTYDLDTSTTLAASLSPEQEADIVNLSTEHGYEKTFLRMLSPNQLQAVKNRHLHNIPQDSPLYNYFSDPSAVAISGNDVALLTRLQNYFKNLPQEAEKVSEALQLAPKAASLGLDAGRLIDTTGRMNYASMWDNREQVAKSFGFSGTDEELVNAETELNLIQQSIKGLGYDESLIIAGAASTGELSGQLFSTFTTGATGGTATVGAAVGAAVAGATVLAPALAPVTIPLATAVTTGAGVGAQVGLVYDSYVVESGHAYSQFKNLKDLNDKTLDKDIAKVAAVSTGVINAGIEGSLGVMALKYLGQLTPQGRAAVAAAKRSTTSAVSHALLNETFRQRISGIIKNYAKGVTAETVTEIAQEVVPVIAEELAKNAGNVYGDNYFTKVKGATDLYGVFDEENIKAYTEVGKKALLGSAGIGAPAAFTHASAAAVEANRAEKFVAVLDDVKAQIGQSSTLKYSAEQASKALKIVGFDQTAWLDAKALQEIIANDSEALSKLGITPEVAQTAIGKNGALEIAVADLPTKLNDEQYAFIKDRVRQTIDSKTATEAKAFDVKAELGNMQDVIAQLNEEQSAFNTRINELTGTVRKIAQKKGWSNDYASTAMQTVESFAFRHAITEKQDAADFVNRLNIEDLTDTVEYSQNATQSQGTKRRVGGRANIADNNYLIQLFNDANVSTLFHELGHVFLSEVEYLNHKGVASKRMQKDLAVLKSWFKAGDNKNQNYQELFARSFEKYLMEGVAPSVELRAPFERYRDWMKSVYKTTKTLSDQAKFEVKYTPEVAEVFDRMLATDEQIDLAAMDMDIVFDSKSINQMDMTEQEKTQAKNLLSAMRKNSAQRLQWEKERAAAIREAQWRRDAKAAIKKNPVYAARDNLKKAPMDTVMLRDLVGTKVMERMKTKQIGIFKNDTGRAPEIAASENGFNSVQEMVEALSAAPTQKEFIAQFIKDARARYEASSFSAAEAIMFEEKSSQYLETVGKVLARKLGFDNEHRSARALKQWAERVIGNEKIKNATATGNYIRRFRGAMNRQKALLAKGDYTNALRELNLAREEMAKSQASRDARRYVDRAERRLKKSAKTKTPMDVTFRENLVIFLNRMGLIQRKNLPEPTRKLEDVLSTYFGDQNDAVIPMMPPSLPAAASGAQVKSFRDSLTLNDFREVDAFATWLFGMGKRIAAGTMAELEGTEATAVEALLNDLNTLPKKGKPFAKDGLLRTISDDARKALAHMLNPDVMWRLLDGYQDNGSHTRMIWRKLNKHLGDMQNRLDELQDIMRPVANYLSKRAAKMPRMITSETVDVEIPPVPKIMQEDSQSWTYERILMIGLNQGTSYNKQAIMDGYGLTETQVTQLLSVLTDEDWDAIAKITEIIDSQWDLLSSAYQKLNMMKPTKVKAEAFVTPTGKKMQGGYFPIKFDPDLSIKVDERFQVQDAMQSISAAFIPPKPVSGMLKERTGTAGLPVSLSLSTVSSHLRDTSLYGHVAPILNDIDRITRRPEYRKNVVDVWGKEVYQLIRPYLQDIAKGGKAPPGRFMARLGQFRSMISAWNLGYKLSVAAKQFPAYFTFLRKFGIYDGVAGTLDYMLHPIENFGAIKEMSSFMRHRGELIDETIQQALDISKQDSKIVQYAQAAAYYPIQFADAIITFPAWHAAFKKGQTLFTTLEEAVLYADDMVAATQPSARVQDKSAFQRDRGSILMALNFFRGWSIKYGNELYYQTSGWAAGKVKTLDMVRFMAIDAILAPFLTYATITALRGKEFEKEEVLSELVSYQFAGLPVVGELVNVGTKLAQNKFATNIFDTPLTDIGAKMVDFGRLLMNKDEDKAKKIAWSLASGYSFIMKVPVLRLYEDLMEGRRQFTQNKRLMSFLFPDPAKKQKGR